MDLGLELQTKKVGVSTLCNAASRGAVCRNGTRAPNWKAAPTGSPDIVLSPQAVMTSSASNLGEACCVERRGRGTFAIQTMQQTESMFWAMRESFGLSVPIRLPGGASTQLRIRNSRRSYPGSYPRKCCPSAGRADTHCDRMVAPLFGSL
jgi:hypothetical protein